MLEAVENRKNGSSSARVPGVVRRRTLCAQEKSLAASRCCWREFFSAATIEKMGVTNRVINNDGALKKLRLAGKDARCYVRTRWQQDKSSFRDF